MKKTRNKNDLISLKNEVNQWFQDHNGVELHVAMDNLNKDTTYDMFNEVKLLNDELKEKDNVEVIFNVILDKIIAKETIVKKLKPFKDTIVKKYNHYVRVKNDPNEKEFINEYNNLISSNIEVITKEIEKENDQDSSINTQPSDESTNNDQDSSINTQPSNNENKYERLIKYHDLVLGYYTWLQDLHNSEKEGKSLYGVDSFFRGKISRAYVDYRDRYKVDFEYARQNPDNVPEYIEREYEQIFPVYHHFLTPVKDLFQNQTFDFIDKFLNKDLSMMENLKIIINKLITLFLQKEKNTDIWFNDWSNSVSEGASTLTSFIMNKVKVDDSNNINLIYNFAFPVTMLIQLKEYYKKEESSDYLQKGFLEVPPEYNTRIFKQSIKSIFDTQRVSNTSQEFYETFNEKSLFFESGYSKNIKNLSFLEYIKQGVEYGHGIETVFWFKTMLERSLEIYTKTNNSKHVEKLQTVITNFENVITRIKQFKTNIIELGILSNSTNDYKYVIKDDMSEPLKTFLNTIHEEIMHLYIQNYDIIKESLNIFKNIYLSQTGIFKIDTLLTNYIYIMGLENSIFKNKELLNKLETLIKTLYDCSENDYINKFNRSLTLLNDIHTLISNSNIREESITEFINHISENVYSPYGNNNMKMLITKEEFGQLPLNEKLSIILVSLFENYNDMHFELPPTNNELIDSLFLFDVTYNLKDNLSHTDKLLIYNGVLRWLSEHDENNKGTLIQEIVTIHNNLMKKVIKNYIDESVSQGKFNNKYNSYSDEQKQNDEYYQKITQKINTYDELTIDNIKEIYIEFKQKGF